MPPLRLRTLRDLQKEVHETEEVSDDDDDDRLDRRPVSSSVDVGGNHKNYSTTIQVYHIPHLVHADACRKLLTRIHTEFVPIIQRRGYHVVSISELCCCGDGLDHSSSHSVTANVGGGLGRKRQRSKRKFPIMALNVLGYNRTTTTSRRRKKHTIHLRLRRPGQHHNHESLYSYEEVAATMAHEMAHCEHGPHNAAFYKLMDEIVQQHAIYVQRGIVVDKQGFPMHSNQAYTLGGGITDRNNYNNHNNSDKRTTMLEAAQRRRQRQQLLQPRGPQVLGGNPNLRSWMSPGLAAAQAAEARRLQDELWCQPCSSPVGVADDDNKHVIEVLSSSDSEEDEDDDNDGNDKHTKPAAVVVVDDSDEEHNCKPAAASRTVLAAAAAARPASVVTIDLTESDDDGAEEIATDCDRQAATSTANQDAFASAVASTSPSRRKRPHDETTPSAIGAAARKQPPPRSRRCFNNCVNQWVCTACTFVNIGVGDTSSNPHATMADVVCAMCGTESERALQSTRRLVADLHRQQEVEQSKRDFGGFNIYGRARQATCKLPHLT